jgi:hypothetical protein
MLAMTLLNTACKDGPPPAPQPRFDEVVRRKTVTVYPALVWSGQPSFDHDAARSLGPFLSERAAEAKVSSEEIAPYSVTLTKTRDRAKIAEESVAHHLRGHALRTDLGFWPVYLFAPGTDQAVEIHALLFDGGGRVIRRFKIDRFDTQPRTPAGCTELVKQVVLTRERVYAPAPAKQGK